jgi:hypothetical protein
MIPQMPDEQNVGCSDIASENGLTRQISIDRQEERRPGVLNLRVQKKKSRFVRPSGHSTRPIPPKLSSIFDEIFGEAEAKDELLALGHGVSDGTADPLTADPLTADPLTDDPLTDDPLSSLMQACSKEKVTSLTQPRLVEPTH